MDSLGKVQLIGTKNYRRRESALHSEVEALNWVLESMLQHSTCQSFWTDYKYLIAIIKESHAWPSFATELEKIKTVDIIPKLQNHLCSSSTKWIVGLFS